MENTEASCGSALFQNRYVCGLERSSSLTCSLCASLPPMRTSVWPFTFPVSLSLNLMTFWDICVPFIHFLQWPVTCASCQSHCNKQLLVDSEATQRGPGNALSNYSQSWGPHPSLGSGHTLRSLAPAADPGSPYWVPRAIALFTGRKYTHAEPTGVSKQTPANISKQESDPCPSSDKTGPGIQIFEMKITSQALQSPPHCYSDEETGPEQSPEGLLTLGPSCLHLTVQP